MKGMSRFALALSAVVVFLGVSPAKAEEGQWKKNHPARTRDNQRIRNQENQAKEEYKEGEITKDQERKDIKTDEKIKREERRDARRNKNGGHLNATQQNKIKNQLDQNEANIKGQPAQDAGSANAPAPASNGTAPTTNGQ